MAANIVAASDQTSDFRLTEGLASYSSGGTKARISHAFRDLMSAGLLQLEGERLVLAAIGQEVFDHIHSS